MSKKSLLRVSITVKLLVMFLSVVLTATVVLGIVAFRIASKGMTQSVYNHVNAVTTDVVNQVAAINRKHFQSLHAIAEISALKDESLSLAEKQKAIENVASAIDGKSQNVAFYDAGGNALTADGRLINFGTRAYFKEAFAGKDYVSDPTFSTVTNAVLQHYGVPVYNANKKIIGAVVMVVSGNSVLSTIEKIDMGGGMHPAVINYSTKNTVADANEDAEDHKKEGDNNASDGFAKVFANIFAGKEGIEDFVDAGSKTHLITAYKKIPDTQWMVFTVAPYNLYFGVLKNMQATLSAIIAVTVVIAILVVSILVGILIKPLKTVKESITTIASGNADLTQRIPEASNDEIGDVVDGFNGFVQKLQRIVSNLQHSKSNLITVDSDLQLSTQDASASITEIISNIESVNRQILNQAESVQGTAGAVNEISSNIESLEKMIESQAACVVQASSAVEQMIGNINSVNNSVVKMIDSFSHLQENSTTGISMQNNANEKIIRIEQQSKMLQDANVAIANIASQTNLLAMNAAIEAAHAGEAGKGFAVVADEIRKLSETSTEQSKTIGSELQNIQETIQDVVNVSNETNTAFSAISQSISDTSQIIQQIKGAMEEQQLGSKQIIDALQSMNNSTAEVKTASSEMTVGNKQILAEIHKLQSATDAIKDSVQEMHIGARRINETGAALSEISGKMAGNIKQIGSEIDLFKV
ncbi:MAG: HAMP domain-containing protein [Treponema sp.]|nr:HAMP domain-containing protein [Treponema sp.]